MPTILGCTQIVKVVNKRNVPVTIKNLEEGYVRTIQPKGEVSLPASTPHSHAGWTVPWARSKKEFSENHIELASPAGTKPFCIWQHDDGEDGDYIRYSTDGQFHCKEGTNPAAMRVAGDSDIDWFGVSNREIRIYTEGFVIVRKVSNW